MTPTMDEVRRRQSLTAHRSNCVQQQRHTYSRNTLRIKLLQITADAAGDCASIPHICVKVYISTLCRIGIEGTLYCRMVCYTFRPY